MIGSEKTGQDAVTGKITWRLVDETGREHKHKFFQDSLLWVVWLSSAMAMILQ